MCCPVHIQYVLTFVSFLLFLNRMLKELARTFQKFDSPMPKKLFTRRLTLHSNAKHRALPAPTGIAADSYDFLEIDTSISFFNMHKRVTKHHFLYSSCSIYVELLQKFTFLEVSVNIFCMQRNSNSVITVMPYVTFQHVLQNCLPSLTAVLLRPISEISQTFTFQKYYNPISFWWIGMLSYFSLFEGQQKTEKKQFWIKNRTT